MPDVLRTPEECFANLPAYPLAPHEVAKGGHFLQEWGEDLARAGLAALQSLPPRWRDPPPR